MLCRKFLSFAVMSVLVCSQAANADIKNDSSAHVDIRSTLASSLPAGNDANYEFSFPDGGLRALTGSRYDSHASQDLDSWLMLLVGGGLIVLQLRRKQKTLPQRPLIESENKLFWG